MTRVIECETEIIGETENETMNETETADMAIEIGAETQSGNLAGVETINSALGSTDGLDTTDIYLPYLPRCYYYSSILTLIVYLMRGNDFSHNAFISIVLASDLLRTQLTARLSVCLPDIFLRASFTPL